MSMTDRQFLSTMMAMSWERAKGALLEVVAVKGSDWNPPKDEDGKDPYLRLATEVEAFIKSVEGIERLWE